MITEKIKDSLDLVLRRDDWNLRNSTYDVPYSEKLETGKYELTLPDDASPKNKFNNKPEPIGSFELHPMINCCGICVSTRAYVHPDFRNVGLNTILNSLRIDIARFLGYSLLLCTDVTSNEAQRKVLARNGWRDIYRFLNRRTGNLVAISVINL